MTVTTIVESFEKVGAMRRWLQVAGSRCHDGVVIHERARISGLQQRSCHPPYFLLWVIAVLQVASLCRNNGNAENNAALAASAVVAPKLGIESSHFY
jgi:hypothetical protein